MTKTHRGRCHAGAARFEADVDLGGETSRRNCSICATLRDWKAFVGDEEVRLLQGADALTDYRFDAGSVHRRFCSHCGVETFGGGGADELDADVGGDVYAVDVACLDDATDEELAGAPVDHLDGRNDDWESEPAETRHR